MTSSAMATWDVWKLLCLVRNSLGTVDNRGIELVNHKNHETKRAWLGLERDGQQKARIVGSLFLHVMTKWMGLENIIGYICGLDISQSLQVDNPWEKWQWQQRRILLIMPNLWSSACWMKAISIQTKEDDIPVTKLTTSNDWLDWIYSLCFLTSGGVCLNETLWIMHVPRNQNQTLLLLARPWALFVFWGKAIVEHSSQAWKQRSSLFMSWNYL